MNSEEALRWLEPARGGVFVDCTLGLGGHSQALLDNGASRVVAIDRDAEAIAMARERLNPYGDRVDIVHADYRDLAAVLDARGLAAVDRVLADLGVSSMQLDAMERGFHDHDVLMRITGDTIALSPPLIISESQIGELFETIEKLIKAVT